MLDQLIAEGRLRLPPGALAALGAPPPLGVVPFDRAEGSNRGLPREHDRRAASGHATSRPQLRAESIRRWSCCRPTVRRHPAGLLDPGTSLGARSDPGRPPIAREARRVHAGLLGRTGESDDGRVFQLIALARERWS